MYLIIAGTLTCRRIYIECDFCKSRIQ